MMNDFTHNPVDEAERGLERQEISSLMRSH